MVSSSQLLNNGGPLYIVIVQIVYIIRLQPGARGLSTVNEKILPDSHHCYQAVITSVQLFTQCYSPHDLETQNNRLFQPAHNLKGI